MRIAILGWGSLIWNQGSLQIQDNNWFNDGISLPIEFARISGNRRLTLVINPSSPPVQVLYSISSFDALYSAKNNLREREGTNIQNIGYHDFTNNRNSINVLGDEISNSLIHWNEGRNFGAVIWTDLRSNFVENTGMDFSLNNIQNYFEGLTSAELVEAVRYIFRTPQQIQTGFRPAIENFITENYKSALSHI